jgi:iron(III) transport system substrate-binding protein
MKRIISCALLLFAVAGCGGTDSSAKIVVVYSPHGREMLRGIAEQFERTHPGVDVQSIDMGSQEILDRVRSERANPQGDVWFGAPTDLFQNAAKDSLLAPSAPTWAGALDATSKDAGGLWYGTYVTPEVIAYNSEVVKPGDAPKDWNDVLDPRWKGKVLIRDPLASGTMRTIFGMIMYRSLQATRDTAQGWTWLRGLDGQTKEYVLNPTLLYNKLARQEGLITLWDMPDIEELVARTKLPIGYTLPSSGTPLVIEGVAVLKGAPHAELARQFLEFVGSAPALRLAAQKYYRLPARTDFPADSLPPRMREARAQMHAEQLDWKLLQDRTPEWMRYWDEHVRGRGAH